LYAIELFPPTLRCVYHFFHITDTSTPSPRRKKGSASRSPDALSQGGCDHRRANLFSKFDDPKNFRAEYLQDNPLAPNMCCYVDQDTDFVCGKVFGKDYKVGIRHPIWWCENASKHSHSCKYALCEPCHKLACMKYFASIPKIYYSPGGTRRPNPEYEEKNQKRRKRKKRG